MLAALMRSSAIGLLALMALGGGVPQDAEAAMTPAVSADGPSEPPIQPDAEDLVPGPMGMPEIRPRSPGPVPIPDVEARTPGPVAMPQLAPQTARSLPLPTPHGHRPGGTD